MWQMRAHQHSGSGGKEVAREREANGIDLNLLKHVSPIEWDNIVLYGEYQLKKRLIKA